MAFYTYMTIYYILSTIYSVGLFLIVSKFSRSPKTSLIVLFAYETIYYAFDWITTDYSSATLAVTDPQLLTIAEISDVIFTFAFLTFFMKDNPIVNYMLIYIADILYIIPLFIFTKLQKMILPGSAALAHMQSWNDWHPVLSHGLSAAATLFIFYLIVKKAKPLLMKLPEIALYITTFIIVLLNNAAAIMLIIDGNISKENITLISILAIIFAVIFIIIAIIAVRHHHELINQKLITMEMHIQYEYYTSICQLTKQLRHMKHDIANHLAVIDIMNHIDKDSQEQYKTQLLAHCSEVKSAISSLMPPENLIISNFNKRENHEFFHFLMTLMCDINLDPTKLDVSQSTDISGHQTTTIAFPEA